MHSLLFLKSLNSFVELDLINIFICTLVELFSTRCLKPFYVFCQAMLNYSRISLSHIYYHSSPFPIHFCCFILEQKGLKGANRGNYTQVSNWIQKEKYIIRYLFLIKPYLIVIFCRNTSYRIQSLPNVSMMNNLTQKMIFWFGFIIKK